MAKHGLWIGALMGLLAVGLGAFGAHGFESAFADLAAEEMSRRLEIWEVADRYLMVHALIVIVLGMMGQFNRHNVLEWALYAFVAGTLVFSGSLFALSLTDFSWLGAVAPFGAFGMMVGWVMMLLAGIRSVGPKKKKKKKEPTA